MAVGPTVKRFITASPCVASSRNPQTAPNQVTYTATVTSAGGVPIGNVEFSDESGHLLTAILDNGKATMIYSPSPGGHPPHAGVPRGASGAGGTKSPCRPPPPPEWPPQ